MAYYYELGDKNSHFYEGNKKVEMVLEEVKKNGVVKEASVHKRVIQEILMFAQGIGLEAQNLAYSPITGPKGNIEFLVHFNANCENNKDIDIDDVVGMAHNQLL